jgi:hypothetical protein
MNILDPIRPTNLKAPKFIGFVSGVLAALGGFYSFMVATWWGMTNAVSSVTTEDRGKTITTEKVVSNLNHALDLKGFLGSITPLAIVLIIMGAWGAATLPKKEQRFWAILTFGLGLSVTAVVLWVNLITAGKAGPHYWRGFAFMMITIVAWWAQCAYYHVKKAARTRRKSTKAASPII